MSRKSARFIAQMLDNFTTLDVYELLEDMGYVIKDKMGDWTLTELGRKNGGRMSSGSYLQTPTFDADAIIDKMIEFTNGK